MNKASNGGNTSSGSGKCPKHDIYAYNPSYEWASHKTWFGVAASWLSIAFILFYIILTLRDYIVRPPELVSQGDIDLLQVAKEYPFSIPKIGLRLTYNNVSNPEAPALALANENPFVRFKFQHIVMKNQTRVRETDMLLEPCVVSNRHSLCPVTNSSYLLQGIFFKENFQFLEITIQKCVGHASCAPLPLINSLLASGEFRIIAQVGMEAQQFDVERFHKTGTGFTIQNRSLDYYALPNIELNANIILQARQIQKEQRYIGSPPLPETRIDVLSYFGRDMDLIPRLTKEPGLMTIAIRLHESVRQEEVAYWCPSILDLFGLWGAIASFVATLSIGLVAMQYNKWHFYKHFRNATEKKRAEATQQALTAMNFVRSSQVYNSNHDTPTKKHHREDMYKNLQIQYDALMVEPDLRLFETHHFNSDGRMAMSAAELKFPSTPFGELRRLAIFEHGKKRRAAQFISVWYGRHLVKKGFITDPERKRQLFSSSTRPAQKPSWYQKSYYDGGGGSDSASVSESSHNGIGGSGRFWQALRKRKRARRNSTHDSSPEPSTAAEDYETRLDAMEKGVSSTATPSVLSPLTEQTGFRTPRGQEQLQDRLQRQEQQQGQQQQQPPQIRIPFFHDFVFDA